MSQPKKSKPKPAPRPYHHGDLRRALLEASWRIVVRAGLPALTLRELAREVGVTHAAPYHHFPTRTALLDALAEQAFVGLDAAMSAARAGYDDPLEVLYRVGRAYADYGRERPERLHVMFRPRNDELEGPKPAALAEASRRTFGHLFHTVLACQEHGVAPRGDAYDLAMVAWSLVHGFTTLWSEGPLDVMPPYAGHYERLRDQTLRGLGEDWRRRAEAERA